MCATVGTEPRLPMHEVRMLTTTPTDKQTNATKNITSFAKEKNTYTFTFASKERIEPVDYTRITPFSWF